jgi:hypothetical protein
MAQAGPEEGPREGLTNPKGGFESRRWKPSRGFKVGLAGLAFFTIVLVLATVAAARQGDPATSAETPTASPSPDKDENGKPQRPRDSFLQELPGGVAGDPGAGDGSPGAPASVSEAQSAVPPTPTAGTTTASPSPTVGESAFATPAAVAPEGTVPLTDSAAELASSIESRFGILIQRQGQDWGSDESDQLRNLGAVNDALSLLPSSLVSEVSLIGGRTLTFLSNDHGRTLSGWQPYGDRAANYYTNEDQADGGRHASNQVVLQSGSSRHTVAHEVIHAHQLRTVLPGAFVSALLTAEMKSFMQATGWTQLASDSEVLATGGSSWDGVNDLFAYSGPSLIYTNGVGGTSELYAPNPLEAYAEAAALYYARTSSTDLPPWGAYWDWFAANLG